MASGARLVLVGVAPSPRKHGPALESARDALAEGLGADEAVRRAKDRFGRDSAQSRGNALGMLDALGVPAALGVRGPAAGLFDGTVPGLATRTWAVCLPVLVGGRRYRGEDLTRLPVLRGFVTGVLAAELAASPDALVVPFGKVPEGALRLLVSEGLLDPRRVVFGFPHPSGRNRHRREFFAENRPRMEQTVTAWCGTARRTG